MSMEPQRRVSPTETAFALREESYVICIVAAWDQAEAAHVDRHIAWTRGCWRAIEPFASIGVYVNFLGNEGEGRVRAAYGVNYERLVALKDSYDPPTSLREIRISSPCVRLCRTLPL